MRKGTDLFLLQLMLLLCTLWGQQQVAIKLAEAGTVPLLQVTLRSAIAAVLVDAAPVMLGTLLVSRHGWLRNPLQHWRAASN